MAYPHEIADSATFLASDRASYITGSSLVVSLCRRSNIATVTYVANRLMAATQYIEVSYSRIEGTLGIKGDMRVLFRVRATNSVTLSPIKSLQSPSVLLRCIIIGQIFSLPFIEDSIRRSFAHLLRRLQACRKIFIQIL